MLLCFGRRFQQVGLCLQRRGIRSSRGIDENQLRLGHGGHRGAQPGLIAREVGGHAHDFSVAANLFAGPDAIAVDGHQGHFELDFQQRARRDLRDGGGLAHAGRTHERDNPPAFALPRRQGRGQATAQPIAECFHDLTFAVTGGCPQGCAHEFFGDSRLTAPCHQAAHDRCRSRGQRITSAPGRAARLGLVRPHLGAQLLDDTPQGRDLTLQIERSAP